MDGILERCGRLPVTETVWPTSGGLGCSEFVRPAAPAAASPTARGARPSVSTRAGWFFERRSCSGPFLGALLSCAAVKVSESGGKTGHLAAHGKHFLRLQIDSRQPRSLVRSPSRSSYGSSQIIVPRHEVPPVSEPQLPRICSGPNGRHTQAAARETPAPTRTIPDSSHIA
jgi:hypothetical protein